MRRRGEADRALGKGTRTAVLRDKKQIKWVLRICALARVILAGLIEPPCINERRKAKLPSEESADTGRLTRTTIGLSAYYPRILDITYVEMYNSVTIFVYTGSFISASKVAAQVFSVIRVSFYMQIMQTQKLAWHTAQVPATERINTGYSSKVTWVTHLFANFVGYPFSVATQFLLASREGSSGHSCQESDLDEAFFTLPLAAKRAGLQKKKKKNPRQREKPKGLGRGMMTTV